MDSGNFRLKIQQFLWASFNREGYRIVKSKDVDKKIDEGTVVFLCRHAGRRDEPTFVHTFLPNEKVLAISCITPSTDMIGRESSQNRTVLIDTRELEDMVRDYLTTEVPITRPRSLEEIVLEVNP